MIKNIFTNLLFAAVHAPAFMSVLWSMVRVAPMMYDLATASEDTLLSRVNKFMVDMVAAQMVGADEVNVVALLTAAPE